MGRHRRQRGIAREITSPASRVGFSVAAVGLGALQFGGLAVAAPVASAPAAADSRDAGDDGEAEGVDGTSCTDVRIKACVDLSENETWLLDGHGNVVRGPVPNTHGAEGQETPTGDFVVQWKNKDHVSREFEGAKMPYAVFFDTNGRAFHEGTLERESAGCVRLDEDDAKAFFEHLFPNDRVQIVE